MLLRVLLALEPRALQRRLCDVLKGDDVLIETVEADADALIRKAGRESYDIVFASRRLLRDGGEVVAALRQLPEPPEVIVLCKEEDAEDRARLLAAGCLSVFYTGVPNQVLGEALAAVLERRQRAIEHSITARRSASKPQLSDFVSASPAMRAFIGVARRVAPSDTSLLILGETGVGKERLARAIHAEGPRSNGPFIAVNCGALPETLLESELFGHEQGAFTGAARARRGWFELAHGGTIFLDEVGEMPFHLQVKLLHVLQDHTIQRLGSERSTPVNVRVIAATNRDLVGEVESGRFRRDLYYRLGVVNLTIPPLRERREDIPALIDDYISHFRTLIGREVSCIDEDAKMKLVDYSWPGNVRELINVIERAVLLSDGTAITMADIPSSISGTVLAIHRDTDSIKNRILSTLPGAWLDQPIRAARRRVVGEFEKAYLERLLQQTGGRIGETARRAGIEPRSLFEKMRRYGIRKEAFRRRNATNPSKSHGSAG